MKRARKYPFVMSVRHPDGTINYLAGHGSKDGKGMETVCLFTDDVEQAVSSLTHGGMMFGWPSLMSSHCRTMGIRVTAVVHQTCHTKNVRATLEAPE